MFGVQLTVIMESATTDATENVTFTNLFDILHSIIFAFHQLSPILRWRRLIVVEIDNDYLIAIFFVSGQVIIR